jgi:ketosteroid isomerase-like protein
VRTTASLLIALCAATLPAAGQPAAAAEAELRAVEDRRYQAMIRGEAGALDKLLADDLVYVHSSGSVETKTEFLDTLRSGRLRYKRIAPEDVRVKLSGNLALVTGRSSIDVEREGKPQSFRVRFTAAYEKASGSWRLAAWQTTRLPEN